ncbi:hypothetical protein MRX96_016254 [Rhipicephalus microplus]
MLAETEKRVTMRPQMDSTSRGTTDLSRGHRAIRYAHRSHTPLFSHHPHTLSTMRSSKSKSTTQKGPDGDAEESELQGESIRGQRRKCQETSPSSSD